MQRKIQKPLHETFNDGFLEYGHSTINRNSKGKRVGESFLAEGKLAFRLMSARDEDHELAGSMGYRLDLKLKTLFPPSFRNVRKADLHCIIDEVEYEVKNVDWDSHKRYLFFYLQEVGEVVE